MDWNTALTDYFGFGLGLWLTVFLLHRVWALISALFRC